MEKKLENLARGNVFNIDKKGEMLVQYIDPRKIVLLGRGKGRLENAKSVISIETTPNNLSINPDGKVIINEPYELIQNFNYGKQKKNYAMVDEYLTGIGI